MYKNSLFVTQMRKLHSEEERKFDQLFGPRHPLDTERTWLPHTDVYETRDAIIIKIELAGVRKEDISVSILGKKLTVRGIRQEEDQAEIISYHQMEIAYSEFERSILLPEALQNAELEATYRDGFLRIKIHKPKSHNKRILEVKVS